MTLSNNIRYLRKKKNWSQDELADKLGYKSFTTIQKWETGVSEPPMKKMRELSALFGVDIDALAKTDLQSGKGISVVTHSLRSDESKLLNNYNLLNDDGKEKASAYVDDLTGNTKYTQTNNKKSTSA